MIFDDDKLEEVVQQVLMDERERLYEGWLHYGTVAEPTLTVKRSWRHKKPMVYVAQDSWERYQSDVKELLQAFLYAHVRLEFLERVQSQDYEVKETFDEYIKKTVLECEAEDFERIRERFDEEVCKDYDDGFER